VPGAFEQFALGEQFAAPVVHSSMSLQAPFAPPV
jgi:hypothetical protein